MFLKRNFPGHWASKEFNSGPYANNAYECGQWIQQDRETLAFSSHTALLPPPDIEGVQIFPIVFFRHPIDRIASAYAFERTQGAETPGSILARQTNLKGYVEAQLERGRYSQCRNFHISRIAHMFKDKTGSQAALAITAVESLPFIGLVEEFDQSMSRLIDWLKPQFPTIRKITVTKNVSRDHRLSLEQKLRQIRLEIGGECYQRLLEANADDLALFNHLLKKYS